MLISVVIPTHNPDPTRLARTLEGLTKQSVSRTDWDLTIVDNASSPPVNIQEPELLRGRFCIVREAALGLTAARLAGVAATRGELIVFVDDDNVLGRTYLETVQNAFARLPEVGALGGKSLPEFETPPARWCEEFFPLLALRDLGDRDLVFPAPQKIADIRSFPTFAPIGAGLALRRRALTHWLADSTPTIRDRSGGQLSSGGDNQISLTVLRAGWAVAYIPTLALTHLIPTARLEPRYLARLNHGIQKSWMQVLTLNGMNSWSPIKARTVPLRKLKAWFTYRAWHDTAAFIRWRGACGHFDGRVGESK